MTEIFVNLPPDRCINCGSLRQTGDIVVQFLRAGSQDRVAFPQPPQDVDLVPVAQPNLIVGRNRDTSQPCVDPTDPLLDGSELASRSNMLRLGIGHFAGRRREIFSSIILSSDELDADDLRADVMTASDSRMTLVSTDWIHKMMAENLDSESEFMN
jgi:hypothetical protein